MASCNDIALLRSLADALLVAAVPMQTVEDFKGIFWWEYGHRMLGRTVGLVYTAPWVYFMLRKRLPVELYKRFGVLFGLGAAQGAVGWWMVRSGLEEHGKEQLEKRNEVRVSPYRLATHVRTHCQRKCSTSACC
jgi:cytochrome c oxidase assembly protein subunit 15